MTNSERVLKASRAVRVQGARSAETGVYNSVHEIFEHRATQQSSGVAAFKTRSKPATG